MPGQGAEQEMLDDLTPDLPRGPGSYVLVLWMPQACALTVGSLGRVPLPRGHLLYTGSARGGLRGRLRRYGQQPTRLHWHIDYVMQAAELLEIWYVESAARLECVWVGRLLSGGLAAATRRFGSSDCRCPTHLLHAETRPSPELLAEPALHVLRVATRPPG